MSDMLRITGLVSGMDTDTTVKKLIELEQTKVDKAEQEKQYLEWQKEDYREVANLLRGFQDEFFDVLNSDTYMMSSNTFSMFSGSASVAGVSSSAVSIKTSATSIQGSFTINNVANLATKDKYESSSEILGNIISTDMSDFTLPNAAYDANKQLSFTLDGVTKTITLDSGLDTNQKIADNISSKLQEAFTNVDIEVDLNGAGPNQLEFNIYKDGTAATTEEVEVGHTLTVGSTNSNLLTELGLEVGQSNSVNITKTLEDVFDIASNQSITINGTAFNFAKETTVSEMMTEINSSNAGVTMTYDSFNDKFSLESNTFGTNSTISVAETGTIMATMQLTVATTSHTAAENAEFTVNNVVTTRSSNTFTMNGTEVTLNEIPTGPLTIDVETDTTAAKDLIVNFVDKYNEMISKINDELGERKNYDYEPLTAAQKKDMSDDDIEAWENEARKGGLRNDTALETLTQDLRRAIYESVEGLGITLAEIGIQTSNNYKDGGKLIIDEDKLNEALKARPNEIIELFTKESSTTYGSFTDRTTRYNENGIAARISDILQNNIRITRDPDGNKGYLIDKAGLATGTDATSEMAMKIIAMDEKINDLLEMLANKESDYYADFARMESAMSSYSSQSAWLTSQFGG